MNQVNSEKLIFLRPGFYHSVWGGTKLRTMFGYDEPGDDVGECWGISAHPKHDCVAIFGPFAGMKLSELWRDHRELFGDASGDVFPLLTKIISAQSNLSIQVHPDDDYASDHETGTLGKTECWYVLDAEPGSQLVAGHNARTHEELCEMIDNRRWDDLIRHIDITPGDFIQIDPGTVHAICGGVTLLETQENSDITYRIYDYDRLVDGKLRELHLQQAKDVITVPSPDISKLVIHDDSAEDVVKLISCKEYEVYRIACHDNLGVEFDRPFMLMSVVDGSGAVDGCDVKKGDHFNVPYGYGLMSLTGDMKIIASCLPA